MLKKNTAAVVLPAVSSPGRHTGEISEEISADNDIFPGTVSL